MKNEAINLINNKIITKYFWINNVKFIDTKQRKWTNTYFDEYEVFESNFKLLDNSKMWIFAEAIEELEIEIVCHFKKDEAQFTKMWKFYVSFSYKHCWWWRNWCWTEIKWEFSVSKYWDDEKTEISFKRI